MRNPSNGTPERGSIYTLAIDAVKDRPIPTDIVVGNGSDADLKDLTNNRAKRKLISQTLAHKLIKYAESEGDAKAVKRYWNIYHCQSKIKKINGRTFGNYCKNKLCTLCTANRKAEYIRKYLPELRTWNDPYLVTLTAKSCKANKLEARVDSFVKAFQKVKNRIRDKHRRGKCPRFKGIRSMECNFNPMMRTYNPHFHIIIEGCEMAKRLRQEWMKLWDEGETDQRAQHKRHVKSKRETDLIEVIKYSTKVFSEYDKGNKGTSRIYTAAMYTIDRAFEGHQLFKSFGFTLPKSAYRVPKGMQLVTDVENFEFDLSTANWINEQSDEVLNQFNPDLELLMKLEYHINEDRK